MEGVQFVLLAQEKAAQATGGMTGLEIFLLIVAIIELVLLVLLFGGYRRLREIHFVVLENTLGQVDSFVAAFGDAEQLRDPEKVALVLHELRRFMNSLQESLKKHYDRYSTEVSLLDLVPRKRKVPSATPLPAPQAPTVRVKPSKPSEKKQEKAVVSAEKDEEKKSEKEEKKESPPPPPKPPSIKRSRSKTKEAEQKKEESSGGAEEEGGAGEPSDKEEPDLAPPPEP